MSDNKLTWFHVVAPKLSSIDAYKAASDTGLTVEHSSKPCYEFQDALTEETRRIRAIGAVWFNKKSRTWSVTAKSDCTGSDLAALIGHGISMVERFGAEPRYGLRRKEWVHHIRKDLNVPVAGAWVATVVDGSQALTEIVTSIPDDIGQISEILEAFRIEVSS